MNPGAVNLYHRLPPLLRSAVATARGYQLRWWRYGPGFEEQVEAAREREQWSPERWKNWEENRLARLLHHAASSVPYYRHHWQVRRRQGDKASWEQLENWPILEKETLRQQPKSFLADDIQSRRLFPLHTSGTSGKPLLLWQSRQTLTAWNALIERRRLNWYGVSWRDRCGFLGGQLVTAVSQSQPPFWVWNAALQQLYMSSYHLRESFLIDYLAALKKYRVRYLWGYPSSLYPLARAALTKGIGGLEMAVVSTNAEPLYHYQRQAISAVFGPVCETYGMVELAAAAGECRQGTLHIWPETGKIEILQGETPVSPGQAGDLVCTGLLNIEMPLIRYRVGDRGRYPSHPAACACGRTLPALAAVEGRVDDLLFTRDGRIIGRLDPIFKDDIPVLEAQIIQETLDKIRVRYVPGPDFGPAAEKAIREGIQARMGDVAVLFEAVPTIPRGPNGKFRAVVCRLSPNQRPEGYVLES